MIGKGKKKKQCDLRKAREVLVTQSVRLSATPWTAARQTPLSIRSYRQEYWSGLPCTPPGDLPNPGIEPRSPTLQADSVSSEPLGNLTSFWIVTKRKEFDVSLPDVCILFYVKLI